MKKKIQIIGVPLDLGQTHRGVDMGVSAVRYAGLAASLAQLGYEVYDSGNIDVPIKETLTDTNRKTLISAIKEACTLVYDAAKDALSEGVAPVFLGGDHSIAMGTVGGVTHNAPCGIIWIDAHADFNTPNSSVSKNIHGMTLAALSGEGYPELVNIGRTGPKVALKDVALIGVRDLDAKERDMLKKSGLSVFTMRDIDERGISNVTLEALDGMRHHKRIHVSLDMDAIDPGVAPGVGTPVPGGLTFREAHLLMEIISDTRKLCSMDIVEINPIFDERNKTGDIAVQMAVSLFGKSIL